MLVREAEGIDIKDERRIILRTAPEGLKVLICLAAEEGGSNAPSYWLEYYDDILTVYWDITDSPVGSRGFHCFHPEPKELAQIIKIDAERVLAWVTEYLKNKSEEEEARNHYLYDDENDNSEDDEKEEWR